MMVLVRVSVCTLPHSSPSYQDKKPTRRDLLKRWMWARSGVVLCLLAVLARYMHMACGHCVSRHDDLSWWYWYPIWCVLPINNHGMGICIQSLHRLVFSWQLLKTSS